MILSPVTSPLFDNINIVLCGQDLNSFGPDAANLKCLVVQDLQQSANSEAAHFAYFPPFAMKGGGSRPKLLK